MKRQIILQTLWSLTLLTLIVFVIWIFTLPSDPPADQPIPSITETSETATSTPTQIPTETAMPTIVVDIPPVFPSTAEPQRVSLTPTNYKTNSQAVVDTGILVTWFDGSEGMGCMLAGHDVDGWFWIDDLAVGTFINVTQGPCAGNWKVITNRYERRSVDPYPWMWEQDGNLLLQTCNDYGYGYTIAQRI